MAITKTGVFDFLIDIVPRDDLKPQKKLDGVKISFCCFFFFFFSFFFPEQRNRFRLNIAIL